MIAEPEKLSLTIGRLASAAGVNVETIRFYERRGLLAQPRQRTSGYRLYPYDAVRRVEFIRRAKNLGFSLREIQDLLLLRVSAGATCVEVRQRARAKIAELDDRIKDMKTVREALTLVANRCRGDGPAGGCPILEALDDLDGADADR